MLSPNRPLTTEDIEAIEAASAPLLRLVHARKLVDE
jgi:hypothetical protein